MPSFYPCPCHPSGKGSGLAACAPLSLFSTAPPDERGAMIAPTTKSPAARVWMRLSFLLSFLLLLLHHLSLSSSPPLISLTLLFPPLLSSPLPSLYLPPPGATRQRRQRRRHRRRHRRSSLGPRRYNQGTELKIRKCPCRRDTPDGAL